MAEGRSELRKQQNLYHRSVPQYNDDHYYCSVLAVMLCSSKKIDLSNHYCSVRNDRAQLTRAVTESHDEVNINIDH